MAGMAQSAVDSLLGRLSALLVDEAQLLRGVRGDLRFIRDEMESMNSLLAHLTEAEHRAHHVRTWMKQVVGLARDSEAYVELFARQVGGGPRAGEGLLGSLRRMLHFLRTIPVRHRVATRIRELKDRVRDVGERRLRYGVTVPSTTAEQGQAGGALALLDHVNQSGTLGDIWERSLHQLDDEALFNRGIDSIVERILKPEQSAQPTAATSVAAGGNGKLKQVAQYLGLKRPSSKLEGDVRIFRILWGNDQAGREKVLAAQVARRVYDHPSMAASFCCKARVRVPKREGPYRSYQKGPFLHEILAQVAPESQLLQPPSRPLSRTRITLEIQRYLRGQPLLLLLEHVSNNTFARLLGHDDGGFLPAGSTIITTSGNHDYIDSHPHTIIKPMYDMYSALYYKAERLIGTGTNFGNRRFYGIISNHLSTSAHCSWRHVEAILDLCYPDAFAMKMFLHLIQANPRRTDDELQNINEIISTCLRLNKSISKQMLVFSYNELPSKYKSCLMYLSIFPKGCIITRTSLARRWIAEGIINPTREYYTSTKEGHLDNAALEDVAKHHFEMLVARGFIRPVDISDACNIKTCMLHHETYEFIARIATDVNFVDIDMPQGFAQHLSIHNRITLQACHPPMEVLDGIVASLPYLAKSSQWKLLKVLDLEGCRGLKKKHLKIICKVLLLRYFSLKNTNVTELPKQIEMLTCLETLDIRQTAVRAFATKSIMLPMLKHMLAGHSQTSTCTPPMSNDSDCRFHESFAAVCLPNDIQGMKKLEMLSHVEVTQNVDAMTGIGQLLRLRKLGVILHGKKRDGLLGLLFQQIEKLHDSLRSLSIQINHKVTSDEIIHDDASEEHALASSPKLLQRLKIRGIRNGLPRWLAELDQLVKLTLCETYLGEDALGIISNLRVLACLRLLQKSYNGSKLHIKEGEFSSLKSLIVRGSEITSIHFDQVDASPKLEMIVWTFSKIGIHGLIGVDCLWRLKKVELNGDCDPHPNISWDMSNYVRPDFRHNGQPIPNTSFVDV